MVRQSRYRVEFAGLTIMYGGGFGLLFGSSEIFGAVDSAATSEYQNSGIAQGASEGLQQGAGLDKDEADAYGHLADMVLQSAVILGQLKSMLAQSGTLADDVAKTLDDVAKALDDAPSRASLLDELAQSGVNYTPENIVSIAKDASGKLVFLEKGGAKAGLQHIVQEHGAQFAQQGIAEAQIADAVMAAVTQGKQVGMQGTRPIFEVTFGGRTHRIAVTVGNNGFIVGANPAP